MWEKFPGYYWPAKSRNAALCVLLCYYPTIASNQGLTMKKYISIPVHDWALYWTIDEYGLLRIWEKKPTAKQSPYGGYWTHKPGNEGTRTKNICTCEPVINWQKANLIKPVVFSEAQNNGTIQVF